MRVYEALAQASERSDDEEWADIMREKIDNIMKGAPSGAGIDTGTRIIAEKCSREKLVFSADFHHMTESGYYDGWTEHLIIVTHDLTGLNIRVTGKNRNDIKEYLTEVYHYWLTKEVDWLTGKYTN